MSNKLAPNGGVMEGEDRALQNIEYAGMYWVIVYVMAPFALLFRAGFEWKVARLHPFGWIDAVLACVGLVYCLFPLSLGLAFRRALRKERDRDLLSERTYSICSFRIAQLLFIVYLGMMTFPRGK